MLELSPPERFEFSKPLDWPDWKQNFMRFRLATKLHKEDSDVQVSALVYTIGREAQMVFKSFTLADGDEQKFHQRNHKQGETIQSIVGSLYELAENGD